MAAPTKTAPHPGRALAALIALIVIMLLAILGTDMFSPSQWHKDFKIGLGLDLSSGTQLSMRATTLSGGGQVTLSDNAGNQIIGAAATDRLINMGNTISGSGADFSFSASSGNRAIGIGGVRFLAASML